MAIVHFRQEQNHMATTFSFVVSCENRQTEAARQVLSECHELVAQLELELTEFQTGSPVYQLNQAPPLEPVVFSEAGFELFTQSVRLCERTQGAFDPGAKSEGHSPKAVIQRFGWEASQKSVWRLDKWAHLGFGAIGKGFAIDKVRGLLEQQGFTNYLLSAGGSSQILSGFSSPEEPWCWGWSWKQDESGEPLGYRLLHTSGRPVALGISGFQTQGAHILGTHAKPCLSALVAHHQATHADALSTALFVTGWNKFPDESRKDCEATAVVDANEQVHFSLGFEKLWQGLVAAVLWLPHVVADEAIDLSALGGEAGFNPYLVERDWFWIGLPISIFLITLIHIGRTKPGEDVA